MSHIYNCGEHSSVSVESGLRIERFPIPLSTETSDVIQTKKFRTISLHHLSWIIMSLISASYRQRWKFSSIMFHVKHSCIGTRAGKSRFPCQLRTVELFFLEIFCCFSFYEQSLVYIFLLIFFFILPFFHKLLKVVLKFLQILPQMSCWPISSREFGFLAARSAIQLFKRPNHHLYPESAPTSRTPSAPLSG
ncbi:hypothetical protein B0J14DRAFT_23558 [Halenospora varia]|nr:hypothetical protein B0J14DRAFT_23558 [Halenospora varia]